MWLKGLLPGPWREWRSRYPSSPQNVGPPGSWAPWKGTPWTSSPFCACSRSWPAWTPRESVEGQSGDVCVMQTACFIHNTWQDKRTTSACDIQIWGTNVCFSWIWKYKNSWPLSAPHCQLSNPFSFSFCGFNTLIRVSAGKIWVLWSYHVPKVVHAQTVGVFAQGVLQVVQLDLP